MAVKPVTLVLAIHCHQPVGNFDWVFQEAYAKAYQPFVEALERHPQIRLTLHVSGCLWDWLLRHQPGYVQRVRQLVRRGQVELMGGGYYEPILSLIPEWDRQGQLALMNRLVQRLSGCAPQGAWLAERVWEPGLAKTFLDAGLRYTIVDDAHFLRAGVKEEVLGYYVTEDAGRPLALFPSSKRLRYWLPFREPEQTIAYLRSLRTSDEPVLVTFGDDGEKFGLWPGTYQWVYEEGWLERFFLALEQEADWLGLAHGAEALEQLPPAGRIYLPCGSYDEMQEWSGGYFNNFLVKYPEANLMHKQMLEVSRLARRVTRQPLAGRIRRELYMSQCNCAYWHGVFGGLYLGHLRAAIYQHLLAADRLLPRRPSQELADVDCDGAPEVWLRSAAQAVLVDPAQGGSITAWRCRKSGVNLANTLTRRSEPYHAKLRKAAVVSAAAGSQGGVQSIHDLAGVKDKDVEQYLIFDRYQRSSLRDHCFLQPPAAEALRTNQYDEAGDFVDGTYAPAAAGQGHRRRNAAAVTLRREGWVQGAGGTQALHVEKQIALGDGLTVNYRLANRSAEPLTCWWGMELNVALHDRRWMRPQDHDERRDALVEDEASGLRWHWTVEEPGRLAAYPIETVSESEGGLERTVQGLCLVWMWPVTLPPGGSWTLRAGAAID